MGHNYKKISLRSFLHAQKTGKIIHCACENQNGSKVVSYLDDSVHVELSSCCVGGDGFDFGYGLLCFRIRHDFFPLEREYRRIHSDVLGEKFQVLMKRIPKGFL